MLGVIVSLLIIGLIAGAIARLVVPGRDPMGILGTILLGVVGSFIGDSWASRYFTRSPRTDSSSLPVCLALSLARSSHCSFTASLSSGDAALFSAGTGDRAVRRSERCATSGLLSSPVSAESVDGKCTGRISQRPPVGSGKPLIERRDVRECS